MRIKDCNFRLILLTMMKLISTFLLRAEFRFEFANWHNIDKYCFSKISINFFVIFFNKLIDIEGKNFIQSVTRWNIFANIANFTQIIRSNVNLF